MPLCGSVPDVLAVLWRSFSSVIERPDAQPIHSEGSAGGVNGGIVACNPNFVGVARAVFHLHLLRTNWLLQRLSLSISWKP